MVMKMKSICVFAKYKESWNRDSKREIFKEGNIVWEAYDIVDFVESEDIKWDEMMIVEYLDESKYNQALENLKMKVSSKNITLIYLNLIHRNKLQKLMRG